MKKIIDLISNQEINPLLCGEYESRTDPQCEEHELMNIWLYFKAASTNLVQDMEEDKKVEVFSHEQTCCIASLFEPDPYLGQDYAICKGNKADYLDAIKTSLGTSWVAKDRLPSSDKPVVMVIDIMAFIQRHQNIGSSTFHELQTKYLTKLLSSIPDNYDCIHFVGDRYDFSPDESLKVEERQKRIKICPNKMKEFKPHDTLAMPEWKSFVHNPLPLYKANLLNYIGKSWVTLNKSLPAGCTLILDRIFPDLS